MDVSPMLQNTPSKVQITTNNQIDDQLQNINNQLGSSLTLSNDRSIQTPPVPQQTELVRPKTQLHPADLLYYSPHPPVYDLIGVSNHHGSLNGGHYIAHVDTSYSKDGQSPRWMCFNDARVSQANPNSISGPTAYVLFYKLRDESPQN